MIDLKIRDRQPELMDQPGLDPVEHERALGGLRRVNQISGTASTLFNELRQLSEKSPEQPLRVLDIASGGGDVAVELGLLARWHEVPIRVDGCDISNTAVSLAQSRATSRGLHEMKFFQCDVLQESLPTGYDVLMCSLFLHHLDEADTIALLSKMAAAANKMVLADDLLRTTWGYVLAWAGARLITRSKIVHVDGPLSVRAAYSEQELSRIVQLAGLEHTSFHKHWPQRITVRWIKPHVKEE